MDSMMDDKGRRMRIVLADDQAKVRSALRLVLEQEPGIEVLGEAVDATGLLDWVRTARPDAILLDWELPGLPTDELLQALGTDGPGVRVIALSGLPEARDAACEAGVHAFVSKGDPPEMLLGTVRRCCAPARAVGKESV